MVFFCTNTNIEANYLVEKKQIYKVKGLENWSLRKPEKAFWCLINLGILFLALPRPEVWLNVMDIQASTSLLGGTHAYDCRIERCPIAMVKTGLDVVQLLY